MLHRDKNLVGRYAPGAGLRATDDIYRDVRTWYARDRGETTLRQLLDIMAEG